MRIEEPQPEEAFAEYPRPAAEQTIQDRNLNHLALIIIFGILSSTLAQPAVLGSLPLKHLLKDSLGVKQDQMASFFFLCALPWYFKPFAGILVDAFPLFRTRRRNYLLASATLSAAAWGAVAVLPHTYSILLLGCITVNVFMVFMSTVVGGVLVEAGQGMGAAGRLSALRQFVQSVCSFLNGPLSGFLAGGLFMTAAGVNAVIVFSVFPVAYFFLREKKQAERNTGAMLKAWEQLKVIGKSRNLGFAIIFVGLFYFAPGFNTPLYYRQSNELHMSQQAIGNLGIFSGAAGMLAAVIYGFLSRLLPLRTLIFIGIACAAGGTFFYLFYNNGQIAIPIEAQNGFFFTFAEVSLMDMAVRATPAGCEALGYSLILSMRNVAAQGADVVGSKLSAQAHWNFHQLVFLNAGTTAIVLVILPFLPAVLMRSKDGEKVAA